MADWNFGLILPVCRNMVFVSYIHVLLAAFLMGLAAAAPMGPVTDCVALTIFNPLTILYWVGLTSNWLPFAHSFLGYSAPVWGILMAAAGLFCDTR